MGVDGDFFSRAGPARRAVTLSALPRVGSHAITGVDASIWIHQLARSVDAHAWLAGDFQATIDAFLLRLHKLWRWGLATYVVFDGARHEAKRDEEGKREAKREKARTLLAELRAQVDAGDQVDDGYILKIAKRCVSRSAEFDAELQAALTSNGFRFEVAPFEADSQLAYLARTGLVEYVITEDSDLVILGCPRVLRRLDWKGGAELCEHAKLFDPSDSDLCCVLRGRGEGGAFLLANLAGNDFTKFKNVSLVTAILIMQGMPDGSSSPEEAVAAGKDTLPADALSQLQRGVDAYAKALARPHVQAPARARRGPVRPPDNVIAVAEPRREPSGQTLLQLEAPKPPAFDPLQAVPINARAPTNAGGAVRLKPEDITGAVLPPPDTWTSAAPTKAQLESFGHTRGFTGMSGQTKEQLANRARYRLQMEAERGGPINLRVPEIVDGAQVLINAGQLHVRQCPALDDALKPPPASAWVAMADEATECIDALPFFEQSIYERTFKSKGVGGRREGKKVLVRVESYAFRRVCKKSLHTFAFCPCETRNGQQLAWISLKVPASMVKDQPKKRGDGVPEVERRKLYQTIVCIEVAGGAEGCDYVIDVVAASCPCKAGRLCVHISATMLAHMYLKDRLKLMRIQGGRICTSELCQWVKPQAPVNEDLSRKPLKEINCFKADPQNLFKQQNLPCHGGGWQLPEVMRPELKRHFNYLGGSKRAKSSGKRWRRQTVPRWFRGGARRSASSQC